MALCLKPSLCLAASFVSQCLRSAKCGSFIDQPYTPFSAAYYPQYAEIKKSKDASGFSTAVSGILIISNTIRVFFYLLDPFDVTLLVQSIVVIIGQAALLQLCVVCNAAKMPRTLPKKTFDLSNPHLHWWGWSDFQSFVSAWATIVAVLCLVTVLGWNSPMVAQAVGMAALGLEATMGLPQLIQNAARGSTDGLSTVLILGWVAGDLVKVGTYLSTSAPWQFLLCVAVQITCDCSILGQIVYYRKSASGGESPSRIGTGGGYMQVDRSPSPPIERLPESPRSHVHTRSSSSGKQDSDNEAAQ